MTYQRAYAIVAAKLPVDDPTVEKRLERAWSMIIGYGYEFTPKVNENGVSYYLVDKLSTAPAYSDSEARQYIVDDLGCTCPDAETARSGLCKHRIAVMMLVEMTEGDIS